MGCTGNQGLSQSILGRQQHLARQQPSCAQLQATSPLPSPRSPTHPAAAPLARRLLLLLLLLAVRARGIRGLAGCTLAGALAAGAGRSRGCTSCGRPPEAREVVAARLSRLARNLGRGAGRRRGRRHACCAALGGLRKAGRPQALALAFQRCAAAASWTPLLPLLLRLSCCCHLCPRLLPPPLLLLLWLVFRAGGLRGQRTMALPAWLRLRGVAAKVSDELAHLLQGCLHISLLARRRWAAACAARRRHRLRRAQRAARLCDGRRRQRGRRRPGGGALAAAWRCASGRRRLGGRRCRLTCCRQAAGRLCEAALQQLTH